MRRTAKITQGRVNDLQPEAKKYAVWDTALTGFHVAVLPTGRKAYFLRMRTPDGRQCCPKLGTHGTITADQARDLAKKTAAQIAGGASPAVERRAAKAKREAAQSIKLGVFLEKTYLPHIEAEQRRHKETRRVLMKDWAHLHGRNMDAISELDVSRYRREKAAAGLKRSTIERHHPRG